MSDVIKITNPKALDLPEVKAFLTRILPEDNLAVSGPPAMRLATLKIMVEDPSAALFMGIEENKPKVFAIVLVPDVGNPTLKAQITYFHSEGSSSLRGKSVDTILEFLQSKGHVKVYAINATGRPDSVWARMFQRAGTSKKVGSIMELTFK